jgi:hypothetical protein
VLGGLTESEISRMTAMRDRSRKHIMEGRKVATHHAMGNEWASGNDKVTRDLFYIAYIFISFSLLLLKLFSNFPIDASFTYILQLDKINH